MNNNIEQKIKDSMDIVEVVSQYTTLHKKGVNYVGLCPLHDDRSIGSFAVDPRKNICSCWACGKTGLDPIAFLQEKEHYTYEQALKWLAKLKHIDVEGNDIDIKIEPRKELPPLEMLLMNKQLAIEPMKQREQDTLVRWLRSLGWDDTQRSRIDKVLKLYAVGFYPIREQAYTVFWQADDKGNLRSGKLMAYKPDGHRDKEKHPMFVHKLFSYDADKYEYRATLFGMHLLNRYPGKTVNVVESEKTAIIMSIAYGTLWMATGGMQNLKREILQPIIDQKRDIILYPDKDGQEQWAKRMDWINYSRMRINNDTMHKCWTEADGPKADIADIVVRLIQEPLTAEKMAEKSPQIKNIIDKLELTDV